MARTVDGYQRFPPCEVATPSPFSFREMAVHPRPRAFIRSIRLPECFPVRLPRPTRLKMLRKGATTHEVGALAIQTARGDMPATLS